MQLKQKSPKSLICIFFLFSYLIKLSTSESCPRDKPIFKNNECQSIYCTEKEYFLKNCTISNEFAKIQWLNNFHIFEKKYMYHISVTENYKGELFLSSQKVADDFDKYLFAFNSEGEGLLYDNKTGKYNCFEIIDFQIREYADYNNYIEINGKGYLIGVPTDDDIYLIDYMNNKIKQLDIYPPSKSSDTIFQMKNLDNMIFTAYIFCKDMFNKNCYIHFQKYRIDPVKLDKLVKIQNISYINTTLNSRIYCNENEKGYILCFYVKKIKEDLLESYLSVINPITFEFEDTLLLERNYSIDRQFDETMNLKNDLYLLVHSINDEVIKIEFKNISIIEDSNKLRINYNDYFSNIKQIYINENRKFEIKHGSIKRNDLYKINGNKFVTFIKEYSKDRSISTNSVLLIYIFTIYNNDKNIVARRYLINFELYNKKVNDDIRGFSLGNFFGVVLGLTQSASDSLSIATFMTFGYVNSTEQESIDTKLKYNNTESRINITYYINEIENNLFGYDFLGVKIISLPLEEDSGYFINILTNQKIKEGDIIPRDSQLQFVLSNTYKYGTYLIQFAGIVKEPSFEDMNDICEEIFYYPENETEVNDKEFYEPKTLMGKKVNYKFRLSNCYDSCSKCTSFSNDENDHKCITCREGFYFKEGTNNCYDKIETKFYFDKEKEIFRPCHENCLTCSKGGNGPKEMNCLSCESGFKFYNRSNNCLSCPHYVNIEQNECINEIPEGYYLEDNKTNSTGKCHYLCKTCEAGPYYLRKQYHMNCKKCFFNRYASYDRNCSYTYGITDPNFPVNGECPIDKPIFRNGNCTSLYCTNAEYKYQICVIYNETAKAQWLNDFHFFSELSNSSFSIGYDIIKNQKMLLFSQNINKENGNIDKYVYGFYNNGTGIFYNRDKDIYESFKKINFPENIKLDDKIGHIEMDYDAYYLLSPVENNLYFINYLDNKITKKEIDIPAYSADKIIIMEKEDNSKESDYFSCYIYCKNKTNINDCYLMMKNFESDEKQLTDSKKENIKVHSNSQLNCYKDEENYIRCTYTKYGDGSNYNHVLGIFNIISFDLVKEFEIENNYDNDPTFDSMIRLTNLTSIISYSTNNNKNIIKILIKKIQFEPLNKIFSINDYIPKIPEILINEDNLYKFEGGKASSNSLIKISDDKFALLVNDFKNIYNNDNLNSEIAIFILNIYASNSKINIRHYKINFNFYNYLINKKIIGYYLNGFFGSIIELASPENKDLKKASFFIFGYVNTTDISPSEGNEILIVKNEKIKVKDYIKTIENNIFGYEFSTIKVISVPDEKNAGYFSLGYYNKLRKDDIITINAEIKFIISSNPKTGNYSIVLAPFLTEPKYDKMNSYCRKLETYPKNETDSERMSYNPKTILGKYFTFNFYIENGNGCFPNCETCYQESEDENNQQCKECKEGYYKINGTNNCYSSIAKGYYLDKNNKLFNPCYKDCLSCNDFGNETKMNCLSCSEDKFNYYKKSSNCLKCPKYVDYLQTKCIDEIPDGYYLYDSKLGNIEKCYELCQTCEKGQTLENETLHMNCKTCKYIKNDYHSEIEGNCPDNQDEKKENEIKTDIKKDEDKKEIENKTDEKKEDENKEDINKQEYVNKTDEKKENENKEDINKQEYVNKTDEKKENENKEDINKQEYVNKTDINKEEKNKDVNKQEKNKENEKGKKEEKGGISMISILVITIVIILALIAVFIYKKGYIKKNLKNKSYIDLTGQKTSTVNIV